MINAYVKPGNEFNYENLSDLYGKTVAIQRGFSVSSKFDLAVDNRKISLHYVDRMEQLVKMVLNDRLKVFVAKPSHVSIYLQKTGEKLSVIGNISEPQGTFLVISKAAEIENKKNLIQKIDQAMYEMYQDGTIARITKRYLE